MSKKDQLQNLAILIGLRAAHEILIKLTGKPESVPHLSKEAEHYSDLSFELAEGNWNKEDIKTVKELAKKRCFKKLEKYKDIGDAKYKEIDKVIDNIILDLELKE